MHGVAKGLILVERNNNKSVDVNAWCLQIISYTYILDNKDTILYELCCV